MKVCFPPPWDSVLVFAPGARWEDDLPAPFSVAATPPVTPRALRVCVQP